MVNWDNPEEVNTYNRSWYKRDKEINPEKYVKLAEKKRYYDLSRRGEEIYKKKISEENHLKYETDLNYRMNVIRRSKERKEKIINIVNLLRKNPCSLCNKCFPPYCMDFHHLNKLEKKFQIMDMVNRRFNIKTLLNEIKKCVILCAVCHRIVEYSKNNSDFTHLTSFRISDLQINKIFTNA